MILASLTVPRRLDYCGIAILIIGSIVPLLYYQFYCEFGTKLAYLTMIGLLGITCIVISMWDKFSASEYRVYRACKCSSSFDVFMRTIRMFSSTFYYVRRIRFYSNMSLRHSIRRESCIYRYGDCSLLNAITTFCFSWCHSISAVGRCTLHDGRLYLRWQVLIRWSAVRIIFSIYIARIPERLAPGLFDIWVG